MDNHTQPTVPDSGLEQAPTSSTMDTSPTPDVKTTLDAETTCDAELTSDAESTSNVESTSDADDEPASPPSEFPQEDLVYDGQWVIIDNSYREMLSQIQQCMKLAALDCQAPNVLMFVAMRDGLHSRQVQLVLLEDDWHGGLYIYAIPRGSSYSVMLKVCGQGKEEVLSLIRDDAGALGDRSRVLWVKRIGRAYCGGSSFDRSQFVNERRVGKHKADWLAEVLKTAELEFDKFS